MQEFLLDKIIEGRHYLDRQQRHAIEFVARTAVIDNIFLFHGFNYTRQVVAVYLERPVAEQILDMMLVNALLTKIGRAPDHVIALNTHQLSHEAIAIGKFDITGMQWCASENQKKEKEKSHAELTKNDQQPLQSPVPGQARLKMLINVSYHSPATTQIDVMRKTTDTSSSEHNPRSAIFLALSLVPKGRVVTYGGLARLAGLPGKARLVGHCLKELPEDTQLPWHRVINAQGKISLPQNSPGFMEQERRLLAEGVQCVKGKLPLKHYEWPD
jgi:methylated-DNA-protein-cysteine methyltransferase-like protein